jgi:type II secretory pathway predicted ATPase ExeA
MYRQRFGLTGHPLPKNAQGKTFFDKSPGYRRLERAFRQLASDPGLGVLTADAGVGKTAAIRNLCVQLSRPDHLVLYLCDTAVAPLDLYRTLASEIGVKPSHRRAQLWADIKKTLLHMVDERGTSPILVLDEAQHLSDHFLVDLSGFLNFAFDSRDLLTLWLVGLPPLARHLRMQQHAPLAMRVVHQVHLEPLERDSFKALIEHGLSAAGATESLLSDPARELLFRTSRGVPRLASSLLRRALYEAHERNQTFVDDHVMEAAIDAAPDVQAVVG